MLRVSIITPVFNPTPSVLKQTVDSVIRQSWPEWELLLIDDASPNADVAVVLGELAQSDPRVKVIRRTENGGISRASNDGLAAATGDFIALLDHDDLLVPSALHLVTSAIERDPTIDMVYTDEDKIDDDRRHWEAFAKPDWSPERLRNQMYLGHLLVIRTDLAREVGGFRPDFDGSQDHDLALRVSERARRIDHVPVVLYHWRAHAASTAANASAKPYTWDAGIRAVAEHLERVGIDGVAVPGVWPNTISVDRRMDPNVSVSVVIPTRGTSGDVNGVDRVFVVEAVRSLLAHTHHERLEIVVVYDSPTPEAVIGELRSIAGPKLTLVSYDRPFNYSEKCNLGVLASRGDVILLLNDDVEVIADDIVEQLSAPLREADVGMVGGNLIYPDGMIQHAGHQYSEGGFKHAYSGARDGWAGPFSALVLDREVSGVTGACAALTRETYFAVGGLCEALPGNFNDVDLCRKITARGQRILWLHRARLFHFESRTRDKTVSQWEVDLVRQRWGLQKVDPYVRPEHIDAPLTTPHYAME